MASAAHRNDGFYDKYIRNYQPLSQTQLKRLMEHKYSAEGQSFLEPPMQVFWKWVVEQIPEWWAPNALTITGLIINVSTTLILALYSPDCKQEVSLMIRVLMFQAIYIRENNSVEVENKVVISETSGQKKKKR